MEASEPKWVNPVLNIIGANLLRLGGLQINVIENMKIQNTTWNQNNIFAKFDSNDMNIVME